MGFCCIACPNKCRQSCHLLSESIYIKKNIQIIIKLILILRMMRIVEINIAKNILRELKEEEKEFKLK